MSQHYLNSLTYSTIVFVYLATGECNGQLRAQLGAETECEQRATYKDEVKPSGGNHNGSSVI